MKYFSIVFFALLLASCAGERARESVRHGLLTLNLPQQAFLDVWGAPMRTATMSGNDVVEANWSGLSGPGGFFKGKQTIEVWYYDKIQTELLFGSRHRLLGWHTAKTVQELSRPK